MTGVQTCALPIFSGIYRIIGELNNIQAVDPDGGPYISINSSINNQKVEKIEEVPGLGVIITLTKC